VKHLAKAGIRVCLCWCCVLCTVHHRL
jgi:hypothetical protein